MAFPFSNVMSWDEMALSGSAVSHFDGYVVGNDGCEVCMVVSGGTAEGYREVEAVGGIGDLESTGDAGHPGPYLDDVCRAIVEVWQKIAQSIEVFASADGRADRVANASKAEKVPTTRRFLDPH